MWDTGCSGTPGSSDGVKPSSRYEFSCQFWWNFSHFSWFYHFPTAILALNGPHFSEFCRWSDPPLGCQKWGSKTPKTWFLDDFDEIPSKNPKKVCFAVFRTPKTWFLTIFFVFSRGGAGKLKKREKKDGQFASENRVFFEKLWKKGGFWRFFDDFD